MKFNSVESWTNEFLDIHIILGFVVNYILTLILFLAITVFAYKADDKVSCASGFCGHVSKGYCS